MSVIIYWTCRAWFSQFWFIWNIYQPRPQTLHPDTSDSAAVGLLWQFGAGRLVHPLSSFPVVCHFSSGMTHLWRNLCDQVQLSSPSPWDPGGLELKCWPYSLQSVGVHLASGCFLPPSPRSLPWGLNWSAGSGHSFATSHFPLPQSEPQWALLENERTVFQRIGQMSMIMAFAEKQLWELSTQVRRNKTK